MSNGHKFEKSWRIILAAAPNKRLRRIPSKDSDRIKGAIDEMVLRPFGGDVQKLGGEENSWRVRVGNYRIFLMSIPTKEL